ncbi:hypothetical protein C0Q70_21338 [Pomacea canaliculata]|uniref:Uncharacterized protein n=1 Tax=Pomacea canaliculata TaxID=400727 RepID=A0A2T7NC79_POMCA|nr:hypothetical protein C0Q70_21338 [Pomacea canaliculata]
MGREGGQGASAGGWYLTPLRWLRPITPTSCRAARENVVTYAGGEGGAVKGSGTASPQDQVFPQLSHGKRGPACHQYSENQRCTGITITEGPLDRDCVDKSFGSETGRPEVLLCGEHITTGGKAKMQAGSRGHRL